MRSRKGATLLSLQLPLPSPLLFERPQLFNVKNDYFNLNQFEMVGIWFGVIRQSVFSQLCVYVLYAFLWFAPKYVRLWLKYIKRLLYRLYVCFYTFFYILFFCVVDSLSTANTSSFSFSLASSLCPLHFLSWRWNVDFKILCFFHSLHEKFISVNFFFFHFILHASVSLSHFSCLLIIRTMNFSNFFFAPQFYFIVQPFENIYKFFHQISFEM